MILVGVAQVVIGAVETNFIVEASAGCKPRSLAVAVGNAGVHFPCAWNTQWADAIPSPNSIEPMFYV